MFKIKISVLLLLVLLTSNAMTQENSIGIFRQGNNLASSYKSAIYNSEDQSYILSAKSLDKREQSGSVYNDIAGDFIITANVDQSKMALEGRAGLMVNQSPGKNTIQLKATVDGNGRTYFQWSNSPEAGEADSNKISAPKYNYDVLQLERKGKTILMRAAHWGEPLQDIGSVKLEELGDTVKVGLFINSQNGNNNYDQANFWNVRIDKPVSENYNPGKEGWIGCRMEILDVDNGKRRVIYEKDDRFEAPNWMPSGDKLLFNMDGSLFTIPVEGGKPQKLNTGFADNLNNDHGISFNGEIIAISHHVENKGSLVYTVPIDGGTPELVTPEGPSYWHGWAPNNQEVVYVAMRKGSSGYNIYKKSIKGGDEVALTNTKEGEHVDGCEYSPDGKYIYYNGSASGTMQIWRMKPDGSAKEQLTFDARNDWFPHISPDGKWIAYISFPSTIPVNDHPSFKRVTLNIMPTTGGAPRVIAYLYGGQGTINVPSWSPDSKYLAFVSNSGK
ncbi:TolB family protein [Salinimicrobium sp. HB62]|uniref:TolB family protein n=1 Tax=Salinimicrobium sp. HB62 TaxID=3077781 RepID=UPI002D76F047|nr:biopolymer transporter TolR [Salinimicrobium sp. HB62]